MDIKPSLLHGDPVAPVILGVTSILAFAVIGRVAARKLGQPTVLGELLMGILLGNVAWYFGVDLITVLREGPRVFEVVNDALAGASIDDVATSIFGPEKGAELLRIITGPAGGQVMQVAHSVDTFSRYGIIFMLFMVGLDTELRDLQKVGGDSVRVAIIGIVLPVALGFGIELLLRPDMSLNSRMFVAATLAATSVGISANVLKEMGRSQSREGRIILGAAVCDDILGLILLAIVSGIVVSGSVDLPELVTVVVVSALFLTAAVMLGPILVRVAAKIMRRLDIVEAKMFTSYLFVMVLAWSANLAGLATIIGAFAAGVVLHDSYFREHDNSNGGTGGEHSRADHAARGHPGADLLHPNGYAGEAGIVPFMAGRRSGQRSARGGYGRQAGERYGSDRQGRQVGDWRWHAAARRGWTRLCRNRQNARRHRRRHILRNRAHGDHHDAGIAALAEGRDRSSGGQGGDDARAVVKRRRPTSATLRRHAPRFLSDQPRPARRARG